MVQAESQGTLIRHWTELAARPGYLANFGDPVIDALVPPTLRWADSRCRWHRPELIQPSNPPLWVIAENKPQNRCEKSHETIPDLRSSVLHRLLRIRRDAKARPLHVIFVMKSVERPEPLIHLPPCKYNRILAGIMAGFFGGAMMAVILAVTYQRIGPSVEYPFFLIAGTALGATALLPSASFAIAMTGLVLLLATASMLGALFALITNTNSRIRLLLWGLTYGAGIWFFMQYLFLPMGINIPLALKISPVVFAIVHLVFGLCLVQIASMEKRSRHRTHPNTTVAATTISKKNEPGSRKVQK